MALDSGLVAATLAGEISSINLRATLTLMILIGYLPCARWYLRQWISGSIAALNQYFALDIDHKIISEKRLLLGSVIGLSAFLSMFVIIPSQSIELLQPWNWSQDFAVVVFALSFVGWWIGRFSVELIWSALRLTDIAKDLPELNLLDVEANKPFTQQGVQSALLIVIMMSITGNIAVHPEGGLVGAIFVSGTMLCLATLALVLPMRGIHKRLKEQKNSELAVLRGQIQSKRATARKEGEFVNDEIVALLTLESRIERVAEWPFDLSSLSRVALYLMLGLGSWVGAALVERLMESAW